MSPLTQVQSGHAFEYGIAITFRQQYPNALLVDDAPMQVARSAYERASQVEKDRIVRAANRAIDFLIEREPNLSIGEGYSISISADREGIEGDVRDVIIANNDVSVGISAKNRHRAVRHSRLSQTIDFGMRWFGYPASDQYFNAVKPIFDELRNLTDGKRKWNQLSNKAQRFYLPVLNAFIAEVEVLCSLSDAPKRMVEYMLGTQDFYKIVKENGSVLIQSFNLHNTLGWGNRLRYPARLIEARLKDRSATTVEITFDQGWSLSFRIHNASEFVEPSLKFDVQFIGFPNISQNQINY